MICLHKNFEYMRTISHLPFQFKGPPNVLPLGKLWRKNAALQKKNGTQKTEIAALKVQIAALRIENSAMKLNQQVGFRLNLLENIIFSFVCSLAFVFLYFVRLVL